MWVTGDFGAVLVWWAVFFIIGLAGLPLTQLVFAGFRRHSPESDGRRWWDGGYIFSKAVGMAAVTYLVYVGGTLHILPFTETNVLVCAMIVFAVPILIRRALAARHHTAPTGVPRSRIVRMVAAAVAEELVFFGILLLWSWIKGHEESIRGLEKFMDYGFTQTILHSVYFPPDDMWYAGGTINYYYFGHLTMAVLTRLSGLPLSITFNLMLCVICALTFTMTLSIGVQLYRQTQTELPGRRFGIGAATAGLLTAFLVTFAGNMQTLYAFTQGYTGEDVKPFWQLWWPTGEFLAKVGEGMSRYWYANATRFIPFTIHEFPSYSFVVSDVHGHVLSLPYAILALAVLIVLWNTVRAVNPAHTAESANPLAAMLGGYPVGLLVFFGFLVSVLLMTNAFDGPIYAGLFGVIVLVIHFSRYGREGWGRWVELLTPLAVVGAVAGVTSIPFLAHFSSFATGIGVDCPPAKLANTKIGPFIFETVDKCQKSPLWMMWLLWGFFWFTGAFLLIPRLRLYASGSPTRTLLLTLYAYCFFLIVVPEFLYAKDIYPQHFRSNTMFKLGYQAFIIWSVISAQAIVRIMVTRLRRGWSAWGRRLLLILLIPQLVLVSIFPIFAVRSYFGELTRPYRLLDGLGWFEDEYPDDYAAMNWLTSIAVQSYKRQDPLPVIAEADGDSYTDFDRMSAFAGLPTVIGWGVHEWLWRGTYDVVAPRREDVRLIYETTDTSQRKQLLANYGVTYIVVGTIERGKYAQLNESGIRDVADPVFWRNQTVIYKVRTATTPAVNQYTY